MRGLMEKMEEKDINVESLDEIRLVMMEKNAKEAIAELEEIKDIPSELKKDLYLHLYTSLTLIKEYFLKQERDKKL